MVLLSVVNRPSSKPGQATYRVVESNVLHAASYEYEPHMTEDELDRLTLAQAAERYEGLDWRTAFKPLR
jgi:hypothetical protein